MYPRVCLVVEKRSLKLLSLIETQEKKRKKKKNQHATLSNATIWFIELSFRLSGN